MLLESSLQDLYNSAVEAFPHTTLRQHATNPIKITNLYWMPFKGLKTLFVKALAQNEGKEYNPIIVLKNIKYLEKQDPNHITLKANDGLTYFLETASLEHTNVLVRCNCPDYTWRFLHYNAADKSNYGRDRKKYESLGVRPPANPKELPGACKHLFKMVKALRETKLLF